MTTTPTPYTGTLTVPPTPRIPKDRIPLVRAGFRAWIKANREKKVEVKA